MKRLNWEGLRYYHEKLVRMLESWQLANQQMISTAYTEGDNITIENGVISAEIPEGIQFKTDEQLTTQDKTVVGAINEIKSTLDITIPLMQAGL